MLNRWVGYPEVLVDEQDFVRPRGKRRDSSTATVVVEVQVRDVEAPLQLSHHLDVLWLFNPVKLDGELIDASENRFRDLQECVPLRPFHVDFHDDMVPCVAIPCELMLWRLE